MRLTKAERETIIIFNELEDIAHIFTYNRAWQRHLEKKLGLSPHMDNGFGGKEYDISKKRIKPPRAPRSLSPETRDRLRKNLRKGHFAPKTHIALGKSGGVDGDR